MKSWFTKSPGPDIEEFQQSKPLWAVFNILAWPRSMIRRLYAWVLQWAETRQAEWALTTIAFAESSFFPIPPDPLLIAMVVANPKKYIRHALICTFSSVVGGILGYLIGMVLFESVGQWVIETYHLQSAFLIVQEKYANNAFLAIFTAAFTPIPYKLFTIAGGVFGIDFALFVTASILGRGGRFFLVALLMHHFGKRFQDSITKYIDILSLVFIGLIILGVVVLRYV